MNEKELANFWAKVQVDASSNCWIWIGARTKKNGRGYFRWRGRTGLAYAASYEHWVGSVPEGMELDHTCNDTSCVNWGHLEAVTHQVNTQRRSARVTHCPRGHEYTEENTYWFQPSRPGLSPRRDCRACRKIYARQPRPKAQVVPAVECDPALLCSHD